MSGGVDSSVAAALLVEQGYEVIGVTMKLWKGEDDPFAAHRFGGCCTIGSSEDARRVAAQLDIPYYVLNMQEEFHQAVVDDFVAEYARGRTPNPCARCNEFIKFRAFLDRADELGCHLIATGHYARIEREERNGQSTFHLRRGTDVRKDQSYVLGMLRQRELSRTLLPIGHLEKEETRRIATELGFCVAAKPDSQEICFVEDGDYARFVIERAPEMATSGPILDESGKKLGEHRGLARYTVGQRKGLGIAAPIPLFVTRIDTGSNALVVGAREALACETMSAERATWTNVAPQVGDEILVQMHAHARTYPATFEACDQSSFRVRFTRAADSVTPGQLCVLYRDDEVVGSGTIM
ncbi:MAG: tRNA-uridine 2-sulfurtransferase [Abditibacteriota bacterium]|nr:tRNA-uridine 2-sulfurtransferase [Abditibacteriota bacterium]